MKRLMTNVTGESCVSELVSGNFNLGNFCLSSVGDRGACPVVVCIVSSVALLYSKGYFHSFLY